MHEDQSDLANWTRGDRKARFEQTAERHAGLNQFAAPFLSRMKFVDEQGEGSSPTPWRRCGLRDTSSYPTATFSHPHAKLHPHGQELPRKPVWVVWLVVGGSGGPERSEGSWAPPCRSGRL